MQAKILPNGHARLRGKETGYFTDLATGVPMTHWDNPFTGETVEVFDFLQRQGARGAGPRDAQVRPGRRGRRADRDARRCLVPCRSGPGDGALRAAVADLRRPGAAGVGLHPPLHQPGHPAALAAGVDGPSTSTPPSTSASSPRWPCLEDRSVDSAPFTAGFSRLSPWWPWMRMGGSGDGRRAVRSDVLPQGRPRARGHTCTGAGAHPTPPSRSSSRCPMTGMTAAPTSTWEAYARDVPPEVRAIGRASLRQCRHRWSSGERDHDRTSGTARREPSCPRPRWSRVPTVGLGLEVVRQLAELGSTVFLGSRDRARGRRRPPGSAEAGMCVLVELDVTDDGSVVAAAAAVAEEVDHLDVLVNNAGGQLRLRAPRTGQRRGPRRGDHRRQLPRRHAVRERLPRGLVAGLRPRPASST